MNINANRLISLALLAATMGGCDFNEDFCIRNGELVVWCDFAGITDIPPVPQDRHVIAFGADVPPGEGTTFTQDTLRWSLPQGDYRFLFYTGSYEVVDAGDYHEARLIADTDTVGGRRVSREYRSSAARPVSTNVWNTRNPGGWRSSPTHSSKD